MTYVPTNTQAYVSAYAGVLAGMAVSGWIVDPASGHYAQVAAIAGAFSEAFDQAWNNAADLNNLEVKAIQAVCQNEFAGRGPGSLDNADFILSSNWTIPAIACAALVLEGDVYLASQSIDPGIPGSGSFAPIQQVRYLDTTSLATPNGSIAAPFIDPAAFFAEVASPGGWALMMPATDAGNITMPDVLGVHVVLIGVSSGASDIGSMSVAAQTDAAVTLTLRNLTVNELSIEGASLALIAEGCRLVLAETAGGTLTGSVRFINCTLEATIFPDALFDCDGCTVGVVGSPSPMTIGGGTFHGCTFLPDTQLQFFQTLTLFDCEFGAGFSIICNASQPITCDPPSYARLVAVGVNFPDTKAQLVQVPRILYQQQIGLLNGFIIPAADITEANLGQPSAPPALPGGLVQVQFLGNPNATVTCVGATIDGSGNIFASVLNVSDTLTAEVANGQVFVVFYEPAELLV
jgi:hypothetical protein